MQGDWAADGTTRGGGADNALALVVDSFSGGGGRGCTQDVLEIVPQKRTSNHAKNPSENWIFQGFFHNLRYNLLYDKSFLKTY